MKSALQFIKVYFLSVLVVFMMAPKGYGSDIILPDLGDASSSIITPAQEYELGQKWLRIYRSQVFTESDPFIQDYLERLIRKMAIHSPLKDKRLEILVVDNSALNAFAVPGGIIGIHTGLFKFSQTEQQLSSVIAHELAHLSQRHYARTLSNQKANSIPTLAALLASILIAATAGGEAGLAALSATQATAAHHQLRFSRQMEREADRVGMETLVNSGMSPYAMPEMFEQMQKASRFQRRPPEFLLTHPLTQTRISDSHLRAQQYRKKQYPLSLEFQLVKSRALLSIEKNTQMAIKQFENAVLDNSFSPTASQYGLALAHIKAGNTDIAKKVLDELRASHQGNTYFDIAYAEALVEEENFEDAYKIFDKIRAAQPEYHPLNIRYAEALMKAGDYEECEKLLLTHVERRPKDDYVWYLLAEVHGLTGDIFKVHTARAEYFLLNGLFDKADIQIKNALNLVQDDKFTKARLEQKLAQIQRLKRDFFNN